ncbi:homeobox protein koza-like [Stylophora pistillata]|uniref:homeobox protein koza-like n=1 Tax=Stylophora pistillata TaxID=50429 RepID=UPI000C03F7F9|nr:homeobox protein koza-like [Stylophora pistillata]
MKEEEDGTPWKENHEDLKDSLLSVNSSGNKATVLNKPSSDVSNSPEKNFDENSQVETSRSDEKVHVFRADCEHFKFVDLKGIQSLVCFNRSDAAKEFENKYPTRSSRSRSSFSVEQVLQLERVFDRQKYLGSRDRQRLAAQLQMSETQVKTWFQNRRMKQKKKRAEDVERRTKLSFLRNLAYSMQHGFHSYPPDCDCRPPTYPDTPLVLRTELPSKYACPSASPWSNFPYYPPPPYWGRYPIPY